MYSAIIVGALLSQYYPASEAKEARKQWMPVVKAASQHYDLDWRLLDSLIMAESAWNVSATSHVGAQGLCQLMPKTAEWLKVTDAYNPGQNIWAAAMYLRKLHNRFDDWELTLAAYNAGPTRVGRCDCIPNIKETKNYVAKITKMWDYKINWDR